MPVPAEHFKYSQYLYDSALLKKCEVYYLDTDILSNICAKNTMQFRLALVTNCLHCRRCFSCWGSMGVLKLKKIFQLIFNSDILKRSYFFALGDMKSPMELR